MHAPRLFRRRPVGCRTAEWKGGNAPEPSILTFGCRGRIVTATNQQMACHIMESFYFHMVVFGGASSACSCCAKFSNRCITGSYCENRLVLHGREHACPIPEGAGRPFAAGGKGVRMMNRWRKAPAAGHARSWEVDFASPAGKCREELRAGVSSDAVQFRLVRLPPADQPSLAAFFSLSRLADRYAVQGYIAARLR